MHLNEQAKILIGPYQLSFDITNKCNYRCLHCYNNSGENNIINDEMTDEEVIDLFIDIASMHPVNVCFCGGEPLLRLELLCKCSKILHKSGVKSISLVSNGYYMSKDVALQLLRSHVNRVQISLDGSSGESCYVLRQNKGAFSSAVGALKILKEIKMPEVNIAFCPTKYNISELEDVYKICTELSVTSIRIQPLMTIGRAIQNVNEISPNHMQYRKLINKIIKLNTLNSRVSIEWGDPVDHVIRYKEDQRELFTFTSIKANGSIILSPYLPLSLGNVRKHKLSEYWEHGLASAWSLDISQRLAETITCISDMSKDQDGLPKVWVEDDVEFDIIDNELLVV